MFIHHGPPRFPCQAGGIFLPTSLASYGVHASGAAQRCQCVSFFMEPTEAKYPSSSSKVVAETVLGPTMTFRIGVELLPNAPHNKRPYGSSFSMPYCSAVCFFFSRELSHAPSCPFRCAPGFSRKFKTPLKNPSSAAKRFAMISTIPHLVSSFRNHWCYWSTGDSQTGLGSGWSWWWGTSTSSELSAAVTARWYAVGSPRFLEVRGFPCI